jgi:hypothetical protein
VWDSILGIKTDGELILNYSFRVLLLIIVHIAETIVCGSVLWIKTDGLLILSYSFRVLLLSRVDIAEIVVCDCVFRRKVNTYSGQRALPHF